MNMNILCLLAVNQSNICVTNFPTVENFNNTILQYNNNCTLNIRLHRFYLTVHTILVLYFTFYIILYCRIAIMNILQPEDFV